MSMCRVFSCVVGRGCLLWLVCSLGRTLLTFALLHSVLQGQIFLLLQVFLTTKGNFVFIVLVFYDYIKVYFKPSFIIAQFPWVRVLVQPSWVLHSVSQSWNQRVVWVVISCEVGVLFETHVVVGRVYLLAAVDPMMTCLFRTSERKRDIEEGERERVCCLNLWAEGRPSYKPSHKGLHGLGHTLPG